MLLRWYLEQGWPPAGRSRGRRSQVTFAILTGESEEDIAHRHNRQPQALTGEAARAWLSPDKTEPDALHRLLAQGRFDRYESWQFGSAVGSPSNDPPGIVDLIETP